MCLKKISANLEFNIQFKYWEGESICRQPKPAFPSSWPTVKETPRDVLLAEENDHEEVWDERKKWKAKKSNTYVGKLI